MYCQENNKSTQESQLEQKAFALFKEEKYSEALPLFSQLLSLFPKEPNYNFGYAVCLIETNQQIEKAIKYLMFASSKSENHLINYYLGRAYHLSYKFDEALVQYDLYAQTATPADKKKYMLDSRIAMCNNGKQLIQFISDLTVVDNKKIKSENYYYSYELNDYGGKLIIKPPEFKSKFDKKLEPNNTVVFLPNNANIVYVGSYGENKNNGKDIFKISKLPDGTWGKPENLGDIINTPYDEDYPFFSTDGRTLYFSSKGHNSMGGYDIFKTEFDAVSNKWTKPINLDFPINTPYDDYLYIPDKDEKYAFFASNRETNGDNISVYKIIVDKNPIKREFKDLQEIINTSKLEISSLADIQKAENTNGNKQNKTLNNQTNNENNKLQNNNNFKFKPITYSQNLTTQEINSEVTKDEQAITEQYNEIKKQSNLLFISANDLNKQANEKRVLAANKTEQLKIVTDKSQLEQKKQEIFDLITDAENLENNAVTAYNLSGNLDKVAKDIEKDVEKTKNIKEAIKNADNSNNQKLVDIVNTNKENLNNSQNKYTTIENEINERNKLAYQKQIEADNNEKKYKDNQSQIENLDNEISLIKTQIDNEKNELVKEDLTKKLESKDLKLKEYQKNDSLLEANYDKSKTESDNLNSQLEYLKQTKNKINNDTRPNNELALQIKNINKEQLHKEIFNKELEIDVNNNKHNNVIAQNNNVNINANNNQNNTNLTPEQVKELYKQSENNKNIADSLQNVISDKQKQMASITDQNKHQQIFNEIVQLNEVKEHKIKQSNEQQKIAKANDKTIAQNSNVYKNNSVFPFNNNQSNSNIDNYQKELLSEQYYNNVLNEQKNKLEILNTSLNNTSNENEKQSLTKQISDLKNEIAKNEQTYTQSKANSDKLHKSVLAEIDTNNLTNEQLVLNATQYNLKSKINYNNEQEQILKNIESSKIQLEDYNNQTKILKTDISELNNQLNATTNPQTKKQIQKQLEVKQNSLKELLLKSNNLIKQNNKNLSSIYKDIIDANRVYNENNADVRLANILDKEAEIYFEKASNVRNDATLMSNTNEMQNEYKKADNIEQIAIQKQKYSIDLFVKSRTDLTAQNNSITNSQNVVKSFNNEPIDTTVVPNTVHITLNPDEENQLKTFNRETHKSNAVIDQANKDLADVEEKRSKAANTFSKSEKQQILKGVDDKEQKAYSQLLISYSNIGTADSLKYNVYKNQIETLHKSANDIGNNKLIAKQYAKEAEFYFTEASRIRQKSKSTTDKIQKVDELKKATDLENKALSSQQYAVDVLTDVNPVFFVSTNDLTKVDILDAINQPVNVEDVVHIKTSRIISKLGLPEEELKKLDEVEKKRVISEQLLKDADKYKINIDSLQKIVDMPANAKDKKKAQKQIPKLEKQMFASQFTSAEIDESVNDARFYLYKDKFKEKRLNDNSQEARQGKQLEKDAISKYQKAKSLREKSFVKEDAKKAYEFLVQAKKLEVEAIEDQEKAYGIYLNLKPLEDELKEYALTHQNKVKTENNLLVKTNADITPIETKIDTSLSNVELVANNVEASNNNNEQQNVIKNANNNEQNNNQQVNNNVTDNNNKNLNHDNNNNQNLVNNNEQNNANNNQQNNNQQNANQNINNQNVVENTNINEQNNVNNNQTNNQNNNFQNNNQNVITNNTTEQLNNTEPKFTEKLNKKGFGFSILPVNAYSEQNPIPMNEPLPDGIVFKVQIGAFKAPVKNETFKGLNPITGETLEGSQWVRYYVGLFYSEDAAAIVRDQIKPIGYNDAFIVAYKDGKKITMFEARRLLKESSESENYKQLAQEEVNKIKNRTSNNETKNNNLQNTNENNINKNANNTTNNTEFVNSTNVNKLQGLFYTVQIGVYKTPVSSAALMNLTPIYEEKAYGFIRYTTGKYTDFNKANIEKNRIVQLGIPDAFVSAYYNGKRLSVAEALKLEVQNKNATSEQQEIIYPELEANNINKNVEIIKDSIIFKVQIGKFKEQVPIANVVKYLELASNYGLNQDKDENGIILYSIGKFKTYDEAVKMRDVIVNEGEKDAFIVAYSGKNKISVNDAKRILNQ